MHPLLIALVIPSQARWVGVCEGAYLWMGVCTEYFSLTQTSPPRHLIFSIHLMTRPKQNKSDLPLNLPPNNTHTHTHIQIYTLHLLLLLCHRALMTGHKKTGKEAVIPVIPWKLARAACLCLNMSSPQHWLTSDSNLTLAWQWKKIPSYFIFWITYTELLFVYCCCLHWLWESYFIK